MTAAGPESRASGRGNFFAVDWRCVQDAARQTNGANVALAYLTLARHTSRNHQSTTAAATAIAEKLGLTRGRADLALKTLQNAGLISTPKRGTFRTLTPWALVRAERTKLTDRQREVLLRVMSRRRPITSSADSDYQVAYGLKQRDLLTMSESKTGKSRFAVEDSDMVWLPNSLIDGFSNGAAPLAKLRQTGDAGAVQLLIDIYRHADLPEHGGLPWNYVREKFQRVEIDRFGDFTIWGFATEGMAANWEPLFTQFAAKGQEAGSQALWAAFYTLKDAGLIEIVSYLVDGLSAGSMPIHPYAFPGTGEPEERAVQEAAHAAGLRTARDSKQVAAAKHIKMDRWLCPVRSHVLGVQMIGIVRPVHRAHTKRTAAWRANFLAHCDTHTRAFSVLGQSQAKSVS